MKIGSIRYLWNLTIKLKPILDIAFYSVIIRAYFKFLTRFLVPLTYFLENSKNLHEYYWWLFQSFTHCILNLKHWALWGVKEFQDGFRKTGKLGSIGNSKINENENSENRQYGFRGQRGDGKNLSEIWKLGLIMK